MAKETYEDVLKEYQQYKKDIFDKMNKKIVERKILEKESYNNADMLEQYTKFVNLINEMMKEYLPSEKIVKDKGYADIKESALKMDIVSRQFMGARREIEQANEDFHKSYNEMIKQINILKSGNIGEQILYNRLKIIGNEILIIRNAKYILEDDFEVEHDMIIISKVGVFTIEIKNWNSDSHIDKKGYLISNSGQKQNVVEQTMRHKHHLERLLKKHGKESVTVHPIIAWVNSESSIVNEFEYITVCNYNELEFEILNQEKYHGCYDVEERQEIYNILDFIKRPVNVYPVNVDRTTVAEAVSKIIAGVCIYPKMRSFEVRKKAEDSPGILDIVIRIMTLFDRMY